MPELPEVETVARQLAPVLVGRTVRSVRVLDARLRSRTLPRVAGRKVETVRREGKRVVIRFGPRGRDGGLWLAVHLRMTGRLLWHAGGPIAGRHLRARLLFDRGELLFVDTRRFGTWDWHATAAAAMAGGVDPLAPALTSQRLATLARGSRQNLKAWLLRQDRLAGLGNIYAAEILHRAALSPLRETDSLDPADWSRLLAATRRVLRAAIRHCGTTFSDFQDARGSEGSYQRFLTVYERAGRPCRRCGKLVQRLVQQQRSTYWCAGCQR